MHALCDEVQAPGAERAREGVNGKALASPRALERRPTARHSRQRLGGVVTPSVARGLGLPLALAYSGTGTAAIPPPARYRPSTLGTTRMGSDSQAGSLGTGLFFGRYGTPLQARTPGNVSR